MGCINKDMQCSATVLRNHSFLHMCYGVVSKTFLQVFKSFSWTWAASLARQWTLTGNIRWSMGGWWYIFQLMCQLKERKSCEKYVSDLRFSIHPSLPTHQPTIFLPICSSSFLTIHPYSPIFFPCLLFLFFHSHTLSLLLSLLTNQPTYQYAIHPLTHPNFFPSNPPSITPYLHTSFPSLTTYLSSLFPSVLSAFTFLFSSTPSTHVYSLACLLTCLLTYSPLLPSFLPYSPTCLISINPPTKSSFLLIHPHHYYLLTYILPSFHSFFLAIWPYVLTHLPTSLPTFFPFFILTYLPSFLSDLPSIHPPTLPSHPPTPLLSTYLHPSFSSLPTYQACYPLIHPIYPPSCQPHCPCVVKLLELRLDLYNPGPCVLGQLETLDFPKVWLFLYIQYENKRLNNKTTAPPGYL